MKKFLFLITALFFYSAVNSQVIPPYTQKFDSIPCTGWNHYAVSGTDDWQRGVPLGPQLNVASSAPKVWGTNLTGVTSANSVMALETPIFDLSDMTKIYLLTFAHQYYTFSYHGGNIEYSTDLGATWFLLNGISSEKINWYDNPSCAGLSGQPSWSNTYTSSYKFSSHSLAALQGETSVKFRFNYGGTTNPQDGWMIDNFSIVENLPNVIALTGATYTASKNFPTFEVKSSLQYNGLLPPIFSNTTNYYFSYDNVLDAGDSLLGTKTQNISSSIASYSKTFNMIPGINAGDFYIFYTHDFTNNLSESDELDNTQYCILHIDSTFAAGYQEDFESTDFWKLNLLGNQFEKGISNVHQAEGTHSGVNAWFTRYLKDHPLVIANSTLESPYLDLSSASGNVMCFWYKMKHSITSSLATYIEFSNSATLPDYLTIPSQTVSQTRLDGWDCGCYNLPMLDGSNNAKIRFKFYGGEVAGLGIQDITIDDIYIGQPKPDVSLENKNALLTPLGIATDTISFQFFNSGSVVAGPSTTKFYWSVDSLLDGSDLLIATVNELSIAASTFRSGKVAYTKPTSTSGDYFIVYRTDDGNVLNEMWESNNIGFFKLKQEALAPYPYFNDFESQIDGWSHSSSIGADNWGWGTPTGLVLDTVFSGVKAFHSSTDTLLSEMSRQHLYTPAFDFTSAIQPIMEFDMLMHNGYACQCETGVMNMSYSLDGGANWIVLDTTSQSYNRWYYHMDYEDYGGIDVVESAYETELLFAKRERIFAAYDHYNGRNMDGNLHYVLDMTFLAGKKNVRFRYNLALQYSTSYLGPDVPEGSIVDNFRIREKFIDLSVNYKKSLMHSSKRTNVEFNIYVKNQGNYESSPGIVNFYVSVDSSLDGSDLYIGQDDLRTIRPGKTQYLTEEHPCPGTLANYSYLIYELDATNGNAESVESNNIGYWPLALDSISSYPYLMDFNDSILHGWNTYTTDRYGLAIIEQWRFRNFTAPAEYLYQTDLESGQMFTDRINNTIHENFLPYLYLESPSFNFGGLDSIRLSFDLMCIGNPGISAGLGGNMDFSTDGGITWNLLDETPALEGYNWYNAPSLSELFNEPGWHLLVKPVDLLDSVSFDLSFLRGETDVVLRYKFISNSSPSGMGTPHGMRLDNFKIDAASVDYVANDSLLSDSVDQASASFSVNYSITNPGQKDGRITNTKFYWSNDSIFDSGDVSLITKPEMLIANGDTRNTSATMNHPVPLTQPVYYLFYKTDADSVLEETNEVNNVGSFILTVISTIGVDEVESEGIYLYVNQNELYVHCDQIPGDQKYILELRNMAGQIIYSTEVIIQPGMNRFSIPENIVSGVYIFQLSNSSTSLNIRSVINR
ncbi:MAG: hypothetical protein M3R27_05710 [Bacteroidota bacterium]|nr:hypothetical protein [Bacteroidota bacterium]